MDINSEQEDLLKLDKIFPHLHDFGKFNISLVIPGNIDFDVNGLSYPADAKASELLKKYGYALITTQNHSTYMIYFAELTDKGREAKSAGGHFEYLTKLADKELKEKDRQNKADETSEYDLLQKKYFYKSRYVPHIFSTLALIGTVISLIIAHKALNKKADQPLTLQRTDTTQAKPQNGILHTVDTTLRKAFK